MSKLRNSASYYGMEFICDEPIMHIGKKGMRWGFTDGIRNGLRIAAGDNALHDERYKHDVGSLGRSLSEKAYNSKRNTINREVMTNYKGNKIANRIGYALGSAKNFIGDRFQDVGDFIKNKLKQRKKKKKSDLAWRTMSNNLSSKDKKQIGREAQKQYGNVSIGSRRDYR